MGVYSCRDLIFATKIRSTTEVLGLPTRPVHDSNALRSRLEQVEDGKLNESVTAVLIDLDLEADALALIQQVKTYPPIPIVAFGSHVAAPILDGVQKQGADFVITRSTFTSNLPYILGRFGSGNI